MSFATALPAEPHYQDPLDAEWIGWPWWAADACARRTTS